MKGKKYRGGSGGVYWAEKPFYYFLLVGILIFNPVLGLHNNFLALYDV